MKEFLIFAGLLLVVAMGGPGQNPDGPPAWAYPVAASDYQAPVDDGSVRHVPNSAASIVQQMADFKSGARKSAVPNRTPPILMAKIAKAATDAEVAAAAAYFSGLQPRKIITVDETVEVPKTYVAGFLFAPLNNKDQEPIGNRIVEVAKDLEQFESRDTHSEFIAIRARGKHREG